MGLPNIGKKSQGEGAKRRMELQRRRSRHQVPKGVPNAVQTEDRSSMDSLIKDRESLVSVYPVMPAR